MSYLNKANLRRLKAALGRYKPIDLYCKIKEKLNAPYQDYNEKVTEYLPSAEELERQRICWQEFDEKPLISIVVPTYETDELFLRQMADSVIAQTYPVWQLCIADGSASDKVEQVMRQFYAKEGRIAYRRLEHNGGISENTNQGFVMAKGDYIALLDHDDLLVPSALYEMVRGINETGAQMLYSDEDKINEDGTQYLEPHFKLDFNRELLLGNNYICHFLVVSAEVLKQAGGLDSRYDGAQDFDFVLRCSRCVPYVHHIPRILYHWRVHSGSTAGNTSSKMYAYEAGRKAVENYIKNEYWKGKVTMSEDLGFYLTEYEVPRGLSVGICFWGDASPAHGKIKKQIETELAELDVKEVRYFQEGEEAEKQSLDYIITVNRGIRKLEPGSIARLLGSCARDGVGKTGCKSIAKGKVAQCGFWEENGKPVPRYQGLPQHFRGYMKRAHIPAEVDAVSRDLMVQKVSVEGGKCIVEPAARVWILA